MSETNMLSHYGTKGMRWGVRKDKVSKLSSEELKSRIQRLEMEKRYTTLLSESKGSSRIAQGKKLLVSAIGEGTKQATTNYTKKQVTRILNYTAKKLVGG